MKEVMAMTNDNNDYDQNNGERDVRQDHVLPGVVRWDLGAARGYAGEMAWRCDALRAGKLYSRSLFGTKEEAEQFVTRMQQTEPDQMFNVEAIKTSTMWN
jgi:hypothetical protein